MPWTKPLSLGFPCAMIVLLMVSMMSVSPQQLQAQEPGKAERNAVLIRNVRIFDGKTERLADGMNLLVTGNNIARISHEPIQAPADATIIDGGGRVLTPGLVDSHVHLMISLPGPQVAVASPWYLGIVAKINLEKMLMRGTSLRRSSPPAVPSKANVSRSRCSSPTSRARRSLSVASIRKPLSGCWTLLCTA
jgi:hypothetical protein